MCLSLSSFTTDGGIPVILILLVAFVNLPSAKQIMFSTYIEKKMESAYKKAGKKKKKKIGRGAAWLAFSFFEQHQAMYAALICTLKDCLLFLRLPLASYSTF